MKPLRLPPDRRLAACLRGPNGVKSFCSWAFRPIRPLDPNVQFALSDALHNVSELLTDYGGWVDDERFRVLYLRPFDENWSHKASSPRVPRCATVKDYTRPTRSATGTLDVNWPVCSRNLGPGNGSRFELASNRRAESAELAARRRLADRRSNGDPERRPCRRLSRSRSLGPSPSRLPPRARNPSKPLAESVAAEPSAPGTPNSIKTGRTFLALLVAGPLLDLSLRPRRVEPPAREPHGGRGEPSAGGALVLADRFVPALPPQSAADQAGGGAIATRRWLAGGAPRA